MKWILYVMLFVTPPQNLTKAEQQDRSVFESSRVWTLQSASTMEFSSFDACYSVQDTIANSIMGPKVATMTLRTWCFCDAPNALCPDKDTINKRIQELQQPRVQGTQQSGNKTFSIQRLYPPEKP